MLRLILLVFTHIASVLVLIIVAVRVESFPVIFISRLFLLAKSLMLLLLLLLMLLLLMLLLLLLLLVLLLLLLVIGAGHAFL